MTDKSSMLVLPGGEERRREYRKGNWTLNETMVLIEAKKIDNERRMKRSKESEERVGGSSSSTSRSSEMRWKWVEDHCWRHGCYRSQNQCNDRWDNLMRDFKKVRTYEISLGEEEREKLSYWKLERHERKERNLPSNLLPEIYEPLIEVVERRGAEGVSGSISSIAEFVGEERHMGSISGSMPPMMQYYTPGPTAPAPAPPSPPHALPRAQAKGVVDSHDDEHSNSPERKRRRGEGSSSKNNSHKLSSAISKCACILAEALQASEENEMRRHKDLMSIEEREAKIEQSKAETSVQLMEGLATAINQLASSILGSLADKGPATPK